VGKHQVSKEHMIHLTGAPTPLSSQLSSCSRHTGRQADTAVNTPRNLLSKQCAASSPGPPTPLSSQSDSCSRQAGTKGSWHTIQPATNDESKACNTTRAHYTPVLPARQLRQAGTSSSQHNTQWATPEMMLFPYNNEPGTGSTDVQQAPTADYQKCTHNKERADNTPAQSATP
jgi:hypothetical protein